MKKRKIKIAAALLALCMIIPTSLIGCSAKGKTLVSLDDYKISTNIYPLLVDKHGERMYNLVHIKE